VLLVLETLALVGAAAALAGHALLVGAGAVVLVVLLVRHHARREPGVWCYAVFLVGFVWLLSRSLTAPAPGGDAS
jgi:hypothetical protein